MKKLCKVCGKELEVNMKKPGPKRVEFCSRLCYQTDYNSRPDIKERRRIKDKEKRSTEEYKKKRRLFDSTEKAKERRLQRECKSGSLYKYRMKSIVGYGLTEESYTALLNKQRGCCAICGESMEIIAIDHCHTTGEVRGLLCKQCNSGIGFLREDETILLSAVSYLKR